MPEVDVNYWAVLVAAGASMVVGSLVYGPILGKQWLALMGKKKEDMNSSDAMKPMIFAFLVSIVQAYILAHVIAYVSADTWQLGMQTAVWMWIGFVAASMIMNNLFEQRKWGLVWIFLVNSLLTLLTMGTIIALWV